MSPDTTKNLIEQLDLRVANLETDLAALRMDAEAADGLDHFIQFPPVPFNPYRGPFAGYVHYTAGASDGIYITAGRIWVGSESYYSTLGDLPVVSSAGDETFAFGDYKMTGDETGDYVLGYRVDVNPDTGGFDATYKPVLIAHRSSEIGDNAYQPSGGAPTIFMQGATHTFVPLGMFYYNNSADTYSNWRQQWQGSDILLYCYGWYTTGSIPIVDEVVPQGDWDNDSNVNIVCTLLIDYQPIFQEVKEYVDYWIANHDAQHVISATGTHVHGDGSHSHTIT